MGSQRVRHGWVINNACMHTDLRGQHFILLGRDFCHGLSSELAEYVSASLYNIERSLEGTTITKRSSSASLVTGPVDRVVCFLMWHIQSESLSRTFNLTLIIRGHQMRPNWEFLKDNWPGLFKNVNVMEHLQIKDNVTSKCHTWFLIES